MKVIKCLKLEIWIRKISDIPNSPNENILNDWFYKPKDYDWKKPLLTTLESLLDGILLCCHESKNDIWNWISITGDFIK